MKKNQKISIFISLIYLSVILYITQTNSSPEVIQLIKNIHLFGSGFLYTGLLIFGLEKLNEKMVDSKKLTEEYRIERSDYPFYMIIVGFTSLCIYLSVLL